MRINKMITKAKVFDLNSNTLNYFFKEMYGYRFGEFVFGYSAILMWMTSLYANAKKN